MKMNRRNCISAALAASILAESLAEAEQNSNAEEMQFPLIKKYGGVFPIDGLAEPPLAGMKVVFDVTTEAEPGQLNKGLEVVARFLNLAAAAGVSMKSLRVEVVVHGKALVCFMNQKVYAGKNGGKVNPNEDLIKSLSEAGVPIMACSQAVRRNQFAMSDLHDLVKPVSSAMIVSIDRQQKGWAVLVPH
jgi:intracellular sulfur oxidation DsrE/DsrF family protein